MMRTKSDATDWSPVDRLSAKIYLTQLGWTEDRRCSQITDLLGKKNERAALDTSNVR